MADLRDICSGQRPQWALLALLVTTLALSDGFRLGADLDRFYVPDKSETFKQTCYSQECFEAANIILAAMDRSAKPCEDMYQYACGGWLAKASIPAGHGKWSRYDESGLKNQKEVKMLIESDGSMFKGKISSAIAKLKTYYRTCMDEEKIEEQGVGPILKALNDIGGWPVAQKDWNKKGDWRLQTALAAAKKKSGSPFYEFSSAPDSRNASRHRLVFSQAGLTLGIRSSYLSEGSEKLKTAYLEYVITVARLLGADTSTVPKVDVLKHSVKKVYELEKRLAEIFVPSEKLIDPRSKYNLMSIKRFQKMIGKSFKITEYLRSMFAPLPRPTDDVIVTTPDYFRKLAYVLKDTDERTLANYIGWVTVQGLVPYLPKKFADAELELSRVIAGVGSHPPRQQLCYSMADKALGLAISGLFVDKFSTPKDRVEAVTLVESMKSAFTANLPSVSWLDDQTRGRLRDKADMMKRIVAYPDWIQKPEELDRYYSELDIQPDQILQNLLNTKEFSIKKDLARYPKEPTVEELGWEEMHPHTINAGYYPNFNTIIVPAAFLQPPVYIKGAPRAYIHGALGAFMGHELSHGFDNNGRHYDGHGNMAKMWSHQADDGFKKKSQCYVNQYGNFTVQGQNLNGLFTLGENIADNAGVKFAYAALKARGSDNKALPGINLTDDQLFFLGWSQAWCSKSTPQNEIAVINTDPHAHSFARVKGVLQNSDSFLPSFNCDNSSPYDVKNKCKLW